MSANSLKSVSELLQNIGHFVQETAVWQYVQDGLQFLDEIIQPFVSPEYLKAGIGAVVVFVVIASLVKKKNGSEKLLYKVHPSIVRNNPIIYSLAMFCCVVGIMGDHLWENSVSNERIMLRIGILAKDIKEVYHTDIRWVHLRQSILDRILRVGAIEVASAGTGGVEIAINGIPNPNKAKRIIDQKRREEKENQRIQTTGGYTAKTSKRK